MKGSARSMVVFRRAATSVCCRPAALRGVVVDVVGGDDRDAHVVGQPCQLAVAPRVALQEVLLQLHVERIAPVPRPVIGEQFAGRPPAARRAPASSSGPSRAACEEHDAVGVLA